MLGNRLLIMLITLQFRLIELTAKAFAIHVQGNYICSLIKFSSDCVLRAIDKSMYLFNIMAWHMYIIRPRLVVT